MGGPILRHLAGRLGADTGSPLSGEISSRSAGDSLGGDRRFVYQTPLRHLFLISPRKGAEPLIWLAQGQPGRGWQPGEYYDKREIAATNPQAGDSALCTQLWERSAQMAGLPDTGQAR
jgi:hypothetical protein